MSRAACSAPSAKCGAGVASGARASWALSLSFGVALGRPRHPTVLCLCECVFVKRLGAIACYARIAQRFTCGPVVEQRFRLRAFRTGSRAMASDTPDPGWLDTVLQRFSPGVHQGGPHADPATCNRFGLPRTSELTHQR